MSRSELPYKLHALKYVEEICLDCPYCFGFTCQSGNCVRERYIVKKDSVEIKGDIKKNDFNL